MASIDIVDEAFVAASPAQLRSVIDDPARLSGWFTDLELTVFMDRGLQGVRWSVTGSLVGSMEIWLEEFSDGTIVHYYLRADPSSDGRTPQPLSQDLAGRRRADRIRTQRALSWKQEVWALKDELERDRPVGSPPVASDPAEAVNVTAQ